MSPSDSSCSPLYGSGMTWLALLLLLSSTTTMMMTPCHAWMANIPIHTTDTTTTTIITRRSYRSRRHCQRDRRDRDWTTTATTTTDAHRHDDDDDDDDTLPRRTPSSSSSSSTLPDRRRALRRSLTVVLLGTTAVSSEAAHAATTTTTTHAPLTQLAVGEGSWRPLSSSSSSSHSHDDDDDPMTLPPSFVAYGTRLMLRYDPAVRKWWDEQTKRRRRRSADPLFARLAASFGRTWQRVICDSSSSSSSQRLYEAYRRNLPADEARRHVNLWFALLPADAQPRGSWRGIPTASSSTTRPHEGSDHRTTAAASPPDESALEEMFRNDYTTLLPEPYQVTRVGAVTSATHDDDDDTMMITPPLSASLLESLSSSTTVSSSPSTHSFVTRDAPVYGPGVYVALGVAGGVGCALTHAAVIPLDVVKTRAQTDTSGRSLIQQAGRLVDRQGWSSLFLGAQATVTGYLWYGISVYPSYTASKRWLLASDAVSSTLNPDAIALVAGAVAAVVASLGLTPLEAARIRAVADPRRYAEPGVVGTLQVLADERVLYAGLPSLLTRQVVFGSIKFLAFERFAATLTNTWPDLLGSPDASWLVSLLAGGLSGAVSATVSQPADSLLTYVSAQKRDVAGNMNLWQGLQQMWTREGPGALWRGLGSRSVWAGSIIAGQFFLYDIFRTVAGVSTTDLTQVWNYEIHL